MIHNELRRASALQAALQNALGMKEGGIERAGETLTPIMDLWTLPEWQVLRGETPGGIASVVAAVAAEFSIGALAVPAGANFICVVEEAGFASGGAGLTATLHFALDSAALATLGGVTSTVSRDRRAPSICRTLLRTGTDPAATLGGQTLDQATPTAVNVSAFFRVLPVVLTPGQCLAIIAQTVNVALTPIFKFRERVTNPTELLTR